jgi:hypothetical protein
MAGADRRRRQDRDGGGARRASAATRAVCAALRDPVPSAQFMMNKFRAVRGRKKLRRIRLRSRNKSVVADASDRTGIAIFVEHSTAPKATTIILCIACRREMLVGRMP